jgi:hypothetical protein
MVDGFSIHLELIGNRLMANPLPGQENNPGPQGMLLSTGRASNNLL